MNNSKNRNSMFIVFTGIIISLSRFLLGTIETSINDDKHILIIMAVVNYVALGFVLLFLYNGLCKECKDKISSCGLETAVKKKCHSIVFIFSAILLTTYLVLGVLYMTLFKTNDLNDVISIMALAISIATNGLVDDYAEGYYKLILKIVKSITKPKKQKRRKKKREQN